MFVVDCFLLIVVVRRKGEEGGRKEEEGRKERRRGAGGAATKTKTPQHNVGKNKPRCYPQQRLGNNASKENLHARLFPNT